MFQAYRFLNATKPNLIRSCWLCYDIRPPFYEGISDVSSTQGLTLQSMSCQGLWIGTPLPQYQFLCNDTKSISSLDYHLPPQDGWWSCSTGLTPCFHGQILNQTKSFCVLVQLLPKIIYHSDEQVLQWLNAGTHRWDRRESILAITITTLLGNGLAGAGTGIASLAVQNSHYNSLRAAIDLDIKRIETSSSHLQDSLTSLSEVVLQNRSGLDLVFLQQGGVMCCLKQGMLLLY
ncbi:unnamed protein product [Nyctereutes procyonoides]|uniref:(raccoon dog) hypothetical protein n=1 Tax=Nyctereutes procyonoides TaxID=34880 RepID=A0A811YCN9_NYCPR|nr:unnamed protein product [Nyctereutes procyonoides]